jgi:cytochrome c peroxidase
MCSAHRVNTPVGSDRSRLRAAFVASLFTGTLALGLASSRPRTPAGAAPIALPLREAVGRAPSASAQHSLARVALGRELFFDEALSEPAGTSCASCHDPALGYAGLNGSSTGLARGSRPGHFAARSTPSVMYLEFVRRFHLHWEEDAPLPDAVGGFFWDGRADSIRALVRQPLLNPDEMGNASPRQIASKLATRPYAAQFTDAFGSVLGDPDAALEALGTAIEAFLLSPGLAPFSSRYDDYVQGHGKLSAEELRGLALFKDRAKGGCASCHRLNDELPNPERSVFSDFGFEVVAVPRNPDVPANASVEHYDLGLCRAEHARPANREQRWCGAFRTPSLRNVALRPSYMHNGAFTKLREVVAFYATRGTSPQRWYKSGVTFEDLPPQYRVNVNIETTPYDRGEGRTPRLDDGEIDAIVAFLGTLTDSKLPKPRR